MVSRKQRLAKFTIPRQRGVMPRQRLLEVLNAMRGTPGVWIEGAPGAGKTTLAASYVGTRAVPSVWFRVDASDNDPAEFFGSLSIAAGETPRQGERLPAFAAEHAANALAFAHRYFRALYTRLPENCCVVFDNLHELQAGLPLEVVGIAVDEAPADMQVLLLSRTAPPAEFAALEAARKLARLDEQDLSFTREELHVLLPEHDAAAVAVIHELTRGWSAGIMLAARCWPGKGVQRDSAAAAAAQADSKEAIFRFFAHEVLQKMSAREQRFLQLTALLPETSVAQAQALTHDDDAARILEAMYRRNLFTSYRRGSPNTYQFHALFREYLQGVAEQRMPPTELAATRTRAAQLLLAAGDVSAALDLLVSAGQWQQARAALVDSAALLLRQGRYATVRRWIEALPAEAVERDAWLMYWMGQARAHEDEMAACDWYERAYQRFACPDEDVPQSALGRALCASAAIVEICLASITYKDLETWCQRLRQALDVLPRPLSTTDELSVASAIALATALGVPVLPEQRTLPAIERVLALLEADPRAVDGVYIVNAGYCVLAYCQIHRNEVVFERMRKLVEPRLRDSLISPLAHSQWLLEKAIFQVGYALNIGSKRALDTARATAGQLRAIVERECLREFEFDLLILESHFALADQDQGRRTELIERAGSMLDWKRPMPLCLHSIELCGSHLRCGAVAEALQAAERGQKAARLAAVPLTYRVSLSLNHGYALIAAERAGEALSLVEPLIDGLSDERSQSIAKAFVDLTRAWQVRGHCPDEYLALLRDGIRHAARARWGYMFLHLPEVAARLCADALAHDIEPEYARGCIEQRRLLPPADAGESWPWRVRIRLLGSFELRVAEQAAHRGPKTPRRQIELLQAIAVSGTGGLDTWQALDWLWPDGESGKSPLDVTLHRLRKLLGKPNAIVARDGRLGFDRTVVWSDAAQFEALSAELLAADLTQFTDGQLEVQAARVVTLYRGPLLAGNAPSEWVLGARAHFHSRFERVVRSLGTQLERRSRWATALDVYTRALEHDNLAEELYRGQIRCHLALAQPAEALHAFRRCRQLLSVVLGTPPAPQTLALVRAVREQA